MTNYPLLNFKTETFSFLPYSHAELEEEMIKELVEDLETIAFLPDFLEYIHETERDLENEVEPIRFTSIVYYQNTPIGLISFYDFGNELVFSQGIAPKQRGKGFSSRIRKEVYQYIFENMKIIEKITAYIDAKNTKSIYTLGNFGCDEIENISDKKEKKEYLKITNYNPDFIKHMRNK